MEPHAPTTPNVVFSEEKPKDVPGFKWVRHNDHWDKVPLDNPNKPIEHPPVQMTEVSNPQQNIEPVVIDGVGDLREWLTYFESFGDDPSYEEFEAAKFGELAFQYGVSMRSFDYKNASLEELNLDRKIQKEITALISKYSAQGSIRMAEVNEALRETLKNSNFPPTPNELAEELGLWQTKDGGDEE